MRSCLVFLLMTAAAHAAPIQITGAWARASLPHQDTAAVYLTLLSPHDDQLTGVETPQAGMAMLHTTARHGMSMSMQDVEDVALPANHPVAFAPGGSHIMLMDLKAPLAPGATVHLHLTFAHAPAQDITVPVRPVTASAP